MNTRLLVYRVSKSVQRVELYRWVEKFCVQRNKKVSGKFGCIREVTLEAILTKCGVWGDMVDVITCAIFGDFTVCYGQAFSIRLTVSVSVLQDVIKIERLR